MTVPREDLYANKKGDETPELYPETLDCNEDENERQRLHHHDNGEDLKMEAEMKMSSFFLGQCIDVLDSVDRWSEAEVLKIDYERHRIFVTFIYWQSKWDTWVENIEERTAPFHSKTYIDGQPLRLGQRISVCDSHGKWLEAFVTEEDLDRVKIHYRGYALHFDEYINRADKHRYRQFGPDKKLKKTKQWAVPEVREEDDVDRLIAHKTAMERTNEGYSNSTMKFYGSKASPHDMKHAPDMSLKYDRQRQITEFSERYDHYVRALHQQNLEVHPVEGDGNCLFRAVAHQVYGDQRFHRIVREKCMDYMESQADFYCQFVVGGMQMFPLYLAAKRQNGCWGDDPEIQALCEIYGRPAFIWAYDAQRGAKNLRTFHEAAQVHGRGGENERGVIRLSYYGGGHYDSIHKLGVFDRLSAVSRNQEDDNVSNDYDPFLRSKPGVFEESVIYRASHSQHRHRNQSQSRFNTESKNMILDEELREVAESKRLSEQTATDYDIDLAIRASRNDITYWTEDDLESCLLMSMEMSAAEEKDTASTTSRPTSKSCHRAKDSSQNSSINPDLDGPKRQKMDNSIYKNSSSKESPRGENKMSFDEEERKAMAESLRSLEEDQIRTASELSDQALLDQALKASLQEAFVQSDLKNDIEEENVIEADLQQALALSLNAAYHQDDQNSDKPTSLNDSAPIASHENTDEYMNMLMFQDEANDDPELAMALQFSLQHK